ncbi:MAG: hypothetical protein J2P29_02690, partial [Actinobacteria bacterium]|nr:hypothetical protein [Actinomycetota bacterium]
MMWSGAREPGTAEQTLAPGEVANAMSVAARAPSIHNSQPWKFRPGSQGIELLADPDRKLTAVDPEGRELMISCGAAIFGLRLGLRGVGRIPAIALLPDPAQPLLVGRVRPAGHAARTTAEGDLIRAVPHRHTHRGPFTPGDVPARLIATMQADAAAEGCELRVITDPRVIGRLGHLVRRAAAHQRADAAITAELGRWLRTPGSQARDGVPASARLAAEVRPAQLATLAGYGARLHRLRRSATGLPKRLPARDFGLPGTEQRGGEPPSATAVLITGGDTAVDWLRAGQALDRVLLRAAARWVFASLQSQPLESRRYRQAVQTLLGGNGYPQLLLQFGRSNTAPATPRRPQAEMLVSDETR